MSHARSVTSPRTLAVLLSSSLLAGSLASLGCNRDEKKTEPTAATAGTPAGTRDGVVADPVAPPPSTAVGEVVMASGSKLVALSAEPEILGHLAIASPSRLLADIKTQLVPPKYAGFLEEAALRSFVSMALDKRSNLAMNYDFAAPVGCALLEPKIEDIKLSCTFGYKGGATAFVTDLGELNKQADAGGHLAAYGVEGKSVYIDGTGDTVFVSSGPETHGKTEAYLQRNVIARAGDIHGDIEVVAYVATVFDRYRDQIVPFFEQAQGAEPAPTGNPAIDGAARAWSDYRKRSSKNTVDRIHEFAQFSLFFSVEPAGVMMGGALFPKAGSRVAQEMAVYGGTKLDASFAGSAPSGTTALFAMHMSPKVHELQSAIDGRKMLAEVWAAMSGNSPAAIEAAVAAYQKENAELFDGQTMLALGREPGALFGMTLAARLQAGKSARESYRAWSTAFTPQVVLGPEFSKYVTWQFKADAATIDGVAIDRWTIEPTAEARKGVEKEMDAEGKAFVDKALGGMALHIDRAEVAGNVLFVVAPKAEAAYMRRAIAAAQGKGNVAGSPGLGKVLGRDPETAGILAIDVKEGMAWIRDWSEFGAKTTDVPQNVGTDLGDFYLTMRYTTDGATAMEYVVSQQLIEQLKTLIPQQ